MVKYVMERTKELGFIERYFILSEVFKIVESDTVETQIVEGNPHQVVVRWVDKLQFVRYRHTLEFQLFKHKKYQDVNIILHCIGNEYIEHKERGKE